MLRSLVGSEMCIRDRSFALSVMTKFNWRVTSESLLDFGSCLGLWEERNNETRMTRHVILRLRVWSCWSIRTRRETCVHVCTEIVTSNVNNNCIRNEDLSNISKCFFLRRIQVFLGEKAFLVFVVLDKLISVAFVFGQNVLRKNRIVLQNP